MWKYLTKERNALVAYITTEYETEWQSSLYFKVPQYDHMALDFTVIKNYFGAHRTPLQKTYNYPALLLPGNRLFHWTEVIAPGYFGWMNSKFPIIQAMSPLSFKKKASTCIARW